MWEPVCVDAGDYEEAVVARRQMLQAGALVLVVAGAAVALGSLGDVNDDARLLVGVASVVGPSLGSGPHSLNR